MIRSSSVSPVLPVLLALLAVPTLSAQAPGSDAMESYEVVLPGAEVTIPMVPIPVGQEGYAKSVQIGSPESEADRRADEGPQVEVIVEPFWVGKFEITWDAFNQFRSEYAARGGETLLRTEVDDATWADAVSLPTPLYEQDSAPILAGMGTAGGYPVANISQFAARQFTKWLSKRTGQFYRLPTEAEWEYAARAGTATRYYFGDDAEQLADHGWFFDNSVYEDPDLGHPDFGAGYRKVGTKQPNPWGLFDVYGNVAEWTLDQYASDTYGQLGDEPMSWSAAWRVPVKTFPCTVRGGSWESEPTGCRSASRLESDSAWQDRDPQIPKSLWWFTDGFHVGFRIVRPLVEPSPQEQLKFWESADERTTAILTAGGKEVRAAVDAADDNGQDGK